LTDRADDPVNATAAATPRIGEKRFMKRSLLFASTEPTAIREIGEAFDLDQAACPGISSGQSRTP